jgi:hypothetical protein
MISEGDNSSEHGVTCLSWNDCPFESPRLVVGGYSKMAVVWECVDNKWRQVLNLQYICTFMNLNGYAIDALIGLCTGRS